MSGAGESSAATGIDGNHLDNSAIDAGAVYVFTRTGGIWAHQAYLKASNTNAGDQFGDGIALSGDGMTLAVGAPRERSGATGIDGDQTDNSLVDAGAVYVYTRVGATWSQQAYVKPSNTVAGDRFGFRVAVSGNGSTLAVTAVDEAGAEGAVYMFARAGTAWSQQAFLKASNPNAVDSFGNWIAISGDGSTLVAGAPYEASAATGIDGNQADNSASEAGAAYVFTRSGTAWSQARYVKASNTAPADHFGYRVAVSADATTFAIAAIAEDSVAAGIDGDQTDDSASEAGAVYVFR